MLFLGFCCGERIEGCLGLSFEGFKKGFKASGCVKLHARARASRA